MNSDRIHFSYNLATLFVQVPQSNSFIGINPNVLFPFSRSSDSTSLVLPFSRSLFFTRASWRRYPRSRRYKPPSRR